MTPVDVFIDLSRADPERAKAAMTRLARPDVLQTVAGCVKCAVPASLHVRDTCWDRDSWDIDDAGPVAACSRAMSAAADAERPLLLLLDDVQPRPEAVGVLLAAIEGDPMIGFARPRLTGADDGSIAPLDVGGDSAIRDLPRRILTELPETYLIADAPGRCLLVKPVVLANFGELDTRFHSLAGALWHYMARARRCGYRTLICNRAVVEAPTSNAVSLRPCSATWRSVAAADRELLRELIPDVERVREEFGTRLLASAESRLARGMPKLYATRPSLLLDARNIVAGMNGTTAAALGICAALHDMKTTWDVTLLVPRHASEVHDLETRFSRWDVVTKLPSRQFTAAVRLSQPWHIQEMVDLHTAAAYNCYLFLDTISWDTVYPAPKHLHGTWEFMVDHADGLLFDSEFTRARFARRFPSTRQTPSVVTYFSFDPADYIHPGVTPGGEDGAAIFVVGNGYDHKDVGPTVELLRTAFPYRSIVALGSRRLNDTGRDVVAAEANVPVSCTILESGKLSEAEIHRLYADARIVVFPSFYEGFGFPILTTLAYGRPLVARRSPLLQEIAARCVPPGTIVPFERRDDLVDIIGRLLHGDEVAVQPLGTALEHGRPLSWQDVARTILDFVGDLVDDLSRSQWRSRERTIRQLMAAPLPLTDKGLTWSSAAVDSSAAR